MEITQALLKELFDYDAKRGELINKVNRGSRAKAGKVAGTISPVKGGARKSIRVNKQSFYAHRLVWFWHYGKHPKDQIDHIDGNPLNNKIENLREATHAENCQNKIMQRKCSNKYIGITHRKKTNKYGAQIKVNGNHTWLGLFDTPEEAHAAYCAAKRQLHKFNPEVRDYA